MARPTRDKLVKAARQVAVEKAMAVGLSHGEIQTRFGQEYGCSDRTIRYDIVDVQKKWAAEAEQERPFRRHQTRALLRSIAQRALASGKLSAAVAAASRLMELDGLKIIEVNHVGGVTHTVDNMTSNEKRKKLDGYIKRMAERRGAQYDAIRKSPDDTE